jgi:hypothetical protein
MEAAKAQNWAAEPLKKEYTTECKTTPPPHRSNLKNREKNFRKQLNITLSSQEG